MAEASMCFSGSEAGQLWCEDTQGQQQEPQCRCHLWHSPGCAGPSLLTTSRGAPAHTAAAPTRVTAAQLQLQHGQAPGGRGNEIRSTEIPCKGVHFLWPCPWSLLRYPKVRAVQSLHRDVVYAAAAEGSALRLHLSLPLLLLMAQGRHLSTAAVRVNQPDSTAGPCFLSSSHLPHKSLQSLLVCDHCQPLKHWQCPSLVKDCHPHQTEERRV